MAWITQAFWPLAHHLYRMNRCAKNGVLDQIFEQLQREQVVRHQDEAVKMDSTIVKVASRRHRAR